jgi:uncharacterized protein (TIGR03067 family)
MRRLTFTCLMLTLGLAIVAAVRADEIRDRAIKRQKELKAMTGMWSAEAKGSGNGLASMGGKAAYVSIELLADGTAKVNGPDNIADVTLDPTKEPKTVDIEYVEGPLKGKKQYGIYQFNEGKVRADDTWTLVVGDVDAKETDRPKDLAAAKDKSTRYVFGHPTQPNVKVIE